MEVTFDCPACGAGIAADAELGGDQADCPQCGHTILVPAAGIGPGTTIAGYEVVKKLGTGGMGEVFLAKQLAMDRLVALKVLPPAMTRNEALVERFLQEIRLAARLEHPNIVTSFDAGMDAGYHYLAMSYIEGEDLHDRLARVGHFGEHYALEITVKVAGALEYAWKQHKILHRDIKPANIMIDNTGEVKLMDMGIAKSIAEDSGLTMAGMFVGTPYYMSPEQAKGQSDLDFRADMYSLGATLYHLVTGAKPFDGPNAVSVLSKHLTDPLPPPKTHNPNVSDAATHVIHLMMAKNRDRRYQSWNDLIKDVRLLLDQDPQTLELAIPKEILTADVDDESIGSPPTLTLASQTMIQTLPGARKKALAQTSTTKLLGSPAPAPVAGTLATAPPPPAEPVDISRYVRIGAALVVLLLGFWLVSGVRYIMARNRAEKAVVKEKRRNVAKQSDRDITREVEGALVERATREEVEATADVKLEQLEEMLTFARDFARANPDKLDASIKHFKKVQGYAKGTKYELMVDTELEALEKARVAAPDRVLKRLDDEAERLLAQWDEHGARRVYARYTGPFAAETAPRRTARAAALAARIEAFDAALAFLDVLVPALLAVDVDTVRKQLATTGRGPGFQAQGPGASVVTAVAALIDHARGTMNTFTSEIGKRIEVHIHGRKSAVRARVKAVSDLTLTLERDGKTQVLAFKDLGAATLVPALPRKPAATYALHKGLLALRSGRAPLAEPLFKEHGGLLGAYLAGIARRRQVAGRWGSGTVSGKSDHRITSVGLQLAADGQFRLVINEKRPRVGRYIFLGNRIQFYAADGKPRDSWGWRMTGAELVLLPVPDIEVVMHRARPGG